MLLDVHEVCSWKQTKLCHRSNSCVCAWVCCAFSTSDDSSKLWRIVYADLFLTCNFDQMEYGKTSIYSSATLSWTLAHTHTVHSLTHSTLVPGLRFISLSRFFYGSVRSWNTEHDWCDFSSSKNVRNFMQRNFRVTFSRSHFVFVIYFRLVIIRAINTELECVNNS